LEHADVVLDVAAACGVPQAWAQAQLADAGIKQALINTPNRAADSGVFGVPTFQLDGRLFWGNDRIPHLLAVACGEEPLS
ncbi:MAG: DsbA family protein, partial [Candidatus Macondimonas sp.]